jgi:hypothetical protein
MARSQKSDDQYSEEETKQRMVAALKGARLAGHVPMKEKPKAKKAKPGKSQKTVSK